MNQNLPILSAANMFSTIASIVGSVMVLRSLVDILPNEFTRLLKYYIMYTWSILFPNEIITMVFSEFNRLVKNEIYEAAEIYLSGKISPKTRMLNVSKPRNEINFKITMEKDEEVFDFYDGMKLTWYMVCEDVPQNPSPFYDSHHQRPSKQQIRSFQLDFDKKYKDKVLGSYLPYVLERAKSIREEKKTIKLFTIDINGLYTSLGDAWSSIKFDHPSTFDTLALDPELKNTILEDLDIFVQRREFYKKVGKAWKRGYLLYGPPGTGKSSLIAAIANYLNFDIYDLDLTELDYNSDLRKLMVTTSNKSILVVEDIDCSIKFENREKESKEKDDKDKDKDEDEKKQITLSGLLNFIDGLWSSCGDERIIIFTTNHKEKLDPALLRPGRMDMHINLGFCTSGGFKSLAHNYLGVEYHPLFEDIENLIENVEVTPAEVAEKLMKNRKPGVVLQEFVDHLEQLKIQQDEAKAKEQEEKENQRKKQEEKENEDKKETKIRTPLFYVVWIHPPQLVWYGLIYTKIHPPQLV
ncbi:hypothetical protein AQUCO_00700266v1, partial [Aquilegia coerulea]